MSSSESINSDMSDVDITDFTPPSSASLFNSSVKSSQGSRKDLPQSLNPTPDDPMMNLPCSSEMLPVNTKDEKPVSIKIKVDFIDDSGDTINSRHSSDPEIINIIKSLIRSKEPNNRNSAVNKLLDSDMFGKQIIDSTVSRLSKQFSTFLTSEDCPLRSKHFFSSEEKLDQLDLDSLLENCTAGCPGVAQALSQILFGGKREGDKQRLLTIMMISAYTQNQQINLLPKLIGEFLKRKNCSKAGLELLQRCGISLISKSLIGDQDRIGEFFLNDIKIRKQEIEDWSRQRRIIKNKVTADQMIEERESMDLKVRFTDDDFVPKVKDLGMYIHTNLMYQCDTLLFSSHYFFET